MFVAFLLVFWSSRTSCTKCMASASALRCGNTTAHLRQAVTLPGAHSRRPVLDICLQVWANVSSTAILYIRLPVRPVCPLSGKCLVANLTCFSQCPPFFQMFNNFNSNYIDSLFLSPSLGYCVAFWQKQFRPMIVFGDADLRPSTVWV